MTADDMIARLNEHRPPAVSKLNGSVHHFADVPQSTEMCYQVARPGRSIRFLTAELRNESGDLLATATSTAKIFRKQPRP